MARPDAEEGGSAPLVRSERVLLFVGLVYALSFLVAVLLSVVRRYVGGPPAIAVALFYVFVPALVALFQRSVVGEPVIEPLGLRWRWSRVLWWAWLLMPALTVVSMLVSSLVPGVSLTWSMAAFWNHMAGVVSLERWNTMLDQAAASPVHPFWIGWLVAIVSGPTVHALVACGEELGWRGYLHRELRPAGFWTSSWIIGILWGVWYAPLVLQGYFYPQHRRFGVLMIVGLCLLLSPLLAYLRERSGMVWAAAIAHGTLYAVMGLPFWVLDGGSDLTVGICGAAGFLVLAVANVVLWLDYLPGEWNAAAEQGDVDGD